MNILLSPHNDDEVLFAAYTLMRVKPLIVMCTDGYIQGERGDPITAEQRRNESKDAAWLLDCKGIFLGIKDTELTEENLIQALKMLRPKTVYAPAIQGGNAQHDLVGRVAKRLYRNVIYYTTYTKTELWTKGFVEVVPTPAEIELKNQALSCYTSQINLPATRPHFEAVIGKSEWYL